MPNAMAEIIRLTFGKFPSNLIHSTTVLHLGRNVWLDLFLGETVTILLDTFHVQYLTSLWVLLAFTRLDIQPLFRVCSIDLFCVVGKSIVIGIKPCAGISVLACSNNKRL